MAKAGAARTGRSPDRATPRPLWPWRPRELPAGDQKRLLLGFLSEWQNPRSPSLGIFVNLREACSEKTALRENHSSFLIVSHTCSYLFCSYYVITTFVYRILLLVLLLFYNLLVPFRWKPLRFTESSKTNQKVSNSYNKAVESSET